MSGIARIRKALFAPAYFRDRAGSLPAVPAYFFHQPGAASFGRLARALGGGRFETPFFERLLGGGPARKSEVILSFDDGWSSVFSVAFPLARRFGLRFTLFAAPANLEDSDETRSTLDDGADPAELGARDSGPRGTLTWGEVRAMQGSGLVSVQSHSLHHGQVFTSERPIDFARKGRPLPLQGRAPLLERRDGSDRPVFALPAGTPLHEAGGALFATRRYLESEEARQACVRHVADGGGDDFFRRGDWRTELEKVFRGARPGRWETDEERRERFRDDLRAAKETLESKVPGLRVCMVAPPWGAFHPDLPPIAAETGHELMVLADPLPGRAAEDSPVPLYPRLKGDGIWFLLRGPLGGWVPWVRAARESKARVRSGGVP
ncbi:MAG: polysaccharide deacetylase family protein [Candidatus Eisenbacteria bacterium]